MKLLPVIFAVAGLGGGAAAGHFLKAPEAAKMPPDEMAGKKVEQDSATKQYEETHAGAIDGPISNADYVKLNKQFVVPIVDGDRVGSLIVISMALEADQGVSDQIFAFEPKLRDEFLSVLFKHAQSGGFSGVFTADQPMHDLRASLLYAAQRVLGRSVRAVLVTDIVRQDV